MSEEESYVAISALQHLAYCPRQFALIHVEKLWLDDGATARGQLAHQRVDQAGAGTQAGVRTERSVWLVSERLRIRGIADMVEYSKTAGVPPCPVEMKSGKSKRLGADQVQLCAQALCLEEAHDCRIDFGYLSYRKSRRRMRIELSDELRSITQELIVQAHLLLDEGHTPAPVYVSAKCDNCSLAPLCQPQTMAKRSARAYREGLLLAP